MKNIRLTGRLVDLEGRPLPERKLSLLVLTAAAGRWRSLGGTLRSDGEGRFDGSFALPEAASTAPALRLGIDDEGRQLLLPALRLGLAGDAWVVDAGVMALDESRAWLPDPALDPQAAERLALVALPTVKGRALGVGDDTTLQALREQRNLLQAKLDAALAERDQALAGARNEAQRAEALRLDLDRAEADLKLFREQADQKVEVRDFATRLGEEFDQAQATLKASGGFRLANVEVRTRVFVDEGGKSVQFPNRADRADVAAAPATDIALSFQTAESAASDTGVTVPDVIDLTEGAARRVLASVGLLLQTSHGPSSLRAGSVEGQAMLQTPAAGTSAARGQPVWVVFARDSED